MTVTFDSTTLVNASPEKPMVIGSGGASVFEVQVDCLTNNYADVTAIVAKAGYCRKATTITGTTAVQTTGTKGSLVLPSGTYTNCVIENGVQIEEVEGTAGKWWKYSMKFIRSTA